MKGKLLGVIFLVATIVLSGCAGGESKEAKIGDSESIENLISYKIKKMEVTSSIDPSEPSDYLLHYEPSDSSKKYLDLVLEVTNEQTTDIDTRDVFEGTFFTINEVEYETEIYTEENSKTEISYYGSILPKETTYVHIATEVNESDLPDTVDLKLVINSKSEELKLNRKALQEEKKPMEKGVTLTKEGYYEIALVDAYTAKRVEPENPGNFYSYYESEQGKTYGVVKFTVKNISSNSIQPDEVIKVKAVVDGLYEYTGFYCFEIDGDLEPYGNLDPMVQANVFALIEIPDNMIDKKIEFKVNTAEETKYIEINQ